MLEKSDFFFLLSMSGCLYDYYFLLLLCALFSAKESRNKWMMQANEKDNCALTI